MITKLVLVPVVLVLIFLVLAAIYGSRNRALKKLALEANVAPTASEPPMWFVAFWVLLLLAPILALFFFNKEWDMGDKLIWGLAGAEYYLFFGICSAVGVMIIGAEKLFRKGLPVALEAGRQMNASQKKALLRRTIKAAQQFRAWKPSP